MINICSQHYKRCKLLNYGWEAEVLNGETIPYPYFFLLKNSNSRKISKEKQFIFSEVENLEKGNSINGARSWIMCFYARRTLTNKIARQKENELAKTFRNMHVGTWNTPTLFYPCQNLSNIISLNVLWTVNPCFKMTLLFRNRKSWRQRHTLTFFFAGVLHTQV